MSRVLKLAVFVLLLVVIVAGLSICALRPVSATADCIPYYGPNGRIACSTIVRTAISGYLAIGTRVTVYKDFGSGFETSPGTIMGYQLTYIPDHPEPEVLFVIRTDTPLGGSIFNEQAYEWFEFNIP